MRRAVFAFAALPLLLSACDECAGTPSCHNHPEISVTGQFVERRSGRPVGNVTVSFVRTSGIDLVTDDIRATSDGEGYFNLRVGSVYNGRVQGELRVVPPAPYRPFTMRGVELETSRVRGDGEVLGQLVVNPYLLLVGHVRDRRTLTPLIGARVRVRRIENEASVEEVNFVTDHGGQFSWEPASALSDSVDLEFSMEADGYPRAFVLRRSFRTQFRDNQMTFVILPMGYGLDYAASSGRRGSGDQPPGFRVEFVRTGGIQASPSQVSITPDAAGYYRIPVEPLEEGTLLGQLRILPPAPFRPETVSVSLATRDDDNVVHLGYLGFGSQVFMRAELRDAATGERLPSTTGVTMKRTAGVALAWSNPLPDGDLLAVSDSGKIAYAAPTADSGTVIYDMIVRHPAPFIPDTIRNLSLPSRYSDSAYVAGVINVRKRSP